MAIKPNLHVIDRFFRLTIGLICVYVGFIDTTIFDNQIISILVGVFGAINIFAFATKSCPVYAACGLSTLPKE